jgi:hypothetical protein
MPNLSIVVPAKAGTHEHRPEIMGPRFRGDDTKLNQHDSHNRNKKWREFWI